jgi:hypothetical protein
MSEENPARRYLFGVRESSINFQNSNSQFKKKNNNI